ncbi:MAG TPA: FlgD immunoglobulin-like domain containing protein [Candidatus Eisenbacteria bacterium]|nr:FlgD immunoglobulin-like domain containing protein [Candidatus Eisenbacteria bacterium]
MSRSVRLFTAVAVLMLGMAITGTAHAASASIEQVRNGPATATTTPLPTWVTGNAGASNAHYLESHSTAYRAVLDQLPTDGTVIELIIGYDVKRSGSYALDYLTHYQRVLPHVLFGHSNPEAFDPLAGVTGVGPVVTTAPIPLPTVNISVDPDGPDSEPAMPQPSTSMASIPAAERVMTLFGGTLIDVTYLAEANVGLSTSSSESRVRVRFTANSPKAVLAWGGHIACRWDWGFNSNGSPRSAGGISGSSYHMRLVTWNLGSIGSQDRSMSTDAVYPVPKCGVSNAGPFCAGSTNTHTAPAGMESYAWSLTNNTSGAEIVGSATGTSVSVRTATAGSYTVVVTTGASGFTKSCDATVTVNAAPAADAGADQTVCATAPQVQLAGIAGNGNGAWTGGTGTFNPGRSAMNAVYTPSAAEITAGTVTLTLGVSPVSGPCASASDAMRITIQRAATVNAGPDQTVCATAPTLTLAGTFGGSATGGSWSGGGGAFTSTSSSGSAVYLPTAEEIAAGGVTLTFTTNDPDGPCDAVSDEMHVTITPAATVNAGADLTVCAGAPQAQLAGLVGGAATGGTWSGGTGSYSPNASAPGALYTPSAAEIAAGGVTLTLTTNDPAGPCGAVADQVRVTIAPSATANAGADATVCATSPVVQLAGVLGGAATSGTWSGGSGSFNPDDSTLNATYTPTAGEIAAGGVTLTLVSNDPSGPCAAASDAMRVTIAPAATVNAGADLAVCSSAPQAQLAGVIGGAATGGTWTGGTGSYSPNASSPNATYTPSAAEIAAGGATLTLTTNDPVGPCGAVADQVRITITPAATTNAGPDMTVCASASTVQLAATFGGGASSGQWSGGSGAYSPGSSAPNATYTPSASEIAAGSVTLTFTTNDPSGPCAAASDQMRITIDPAATVNAGADLRVCASAPQAQLSGSLGGGASSGSWSGGAGSFSPKATALNAVYTPTAAEIAAGSVTLTLTTNDPAGPCAAVTDQVRITIDPATVVNAGPDQTVCSSSPQTQLFGAVSGTVSSGSWTGGTGTFNPGRSALNAVYTPSAAEITAGTVTLTLTSAASSGPCPPASDAVTITINRAVTVNAGADVIVCAASPQVQLSATLGNGATSVVWSGGSGTFTPNANTLNPSYMPSAAEIASGSVTLTVTTNDPFGPCPPVSDQVKITFDAPAVTVASRVICSGITPVTMCANVTRGIAPYTYLWSNGATTQCISVADTATYTVTITDSRGCTATGSGRFGWRDCIGMLAHTSVTCSSFMDGTGAALLDSDVNWNASNGVITSIAPGVFFYYTKIIAPSENFTVNLVQTKNNPLYPFCELQQAQVSNYDANCGNLGNGVETGPGQAVVNIQGTTFGKVFVISVKYSLKNLIGSPIGDSIGCHYDFRTVINGVVVDADPEGLQIGGRSTPPAPPTPPRPGDDVVINPPPMRGPTEIMSSQPQGPELELYRPAPNPFTDGMRMAYAVAGEGERVRICVYDLAGRQVRTLADGFEAAGTHTVAWDGRDEHGTKARTGVYFVHAVIGRQAKQVRVTFVK